MCSGRHCLYWIILTTPSIGSLSSCLQVEDIEFPLTGLSFVCVAVNILNKHRWCHWWTLLFLLRPLCFPCLSLHVVPLHCGALCAGLCCIVDSMFCTIYWSMSVSVFNVVPMTWLHKKIVLLTSLLTVFVFYINVFFPEWTHLTHLPWFAWPQLLHLQWFSQMKNIFYQHKH